MFPIILLAGFLAAVGYQLGKSKTAKPVRTLTSGATPPVQPPMQHLVVLGRAVKAGRRPPFALLQLAYREAVATGDPRLVEAVKTQARAWLPALQEQAQPEEEEGPGMVVGQEVATDSESQSDFDGSPESWGDYANPEQVGVPSAPRSTQSCPLEGVDPEAWVGFCENLRTRKPAWSSDKHLGAYEHRKTRLRQLGIPEEQLVDQESQYQALCTDIADYFANCSQLIRDWEGKIVNIGGAMHPVTPSGVLALLKAAGPKGAEGWLSSDKDRERFPGTTELFVRCNGRF